MAWENYRQKGFTIVELLVVIVVIGILAVVTIVAYNGIAKRAERSAMEATLTQNYKLLKSENAKTGQYPSSIAGFGFDQSYVYDYRNFGQTACLSATKNSITRHISTDNTSPTYGSCGQVKAEYWNNNSLSGEPQLVKYENSLNISWGSGSPESGTINNDMFSSRLTTYIIPPVTADYTLYTIADDGERIFVNDSLVFNNFSNTMGSCCTLRTMSPVFSFTAGVPVKVVYEHREGGGGASMSLHWSYGAQARQIIPQSLFRRQP